MSVRDAYVMAECVLLASSSLEYTVISQSTNFCIDIGKSVLNRVANREIGKRRQKKNEKTR